MEDQGLKIKKTAKKLLESIGFLEEPIVTKRDRIFLVRLQLDDPSLLIGRQGEAMEALQHILRLLINSELDFSDHLIVVDINSYREKRTKNIEQHAREIASKVLETGDEIELPFLNSYERRIVHTIIGTIADVESESRGDGQDRKVVIKPKK